jgi:hypothetical protein
MNPQGDCLLVSTISGKAVSYKVGQDDRDLIKSTGVTFNVPCCGAKPVFVAGGQQLLVTDGCVLYRYDCATGKKLQKTVFNSAVEQVYESPKGMCVVALSGVCYVYTNASLEKSIFSASLDDHFPARWFFNCDGSLCALATRRNCFVYRYDDEKLESLRIYQTGYRISQGAFWGEESYLMLCDDFRYYMYDYCDKTLLQMIDLACLDGAIMVVSNDGSYLVVTCENTSTVYGAYPLQTFFKIVGNLLKNK